MPSPNVATTVGKTDIVLEDLEYIVEINTLDNVIDKSIEDQGSGRVGLNTDLKLPELRASL